MNPYHVSLETSSAVGKRIQSKRSKLTCAAMAAVGSILGSSHCAFSAVITNVFTASAASPYQTTDQTGQFVKFTSLAISNLPNISSIPNGQFSSIVGDAAGTFTTNGTTLSNGVTTSDSGNSVYAPFQYDSNGFRLIGQITTSSSGAYSQPNVVAVTPNGQVLGGEGRSSANSSSTGILGSEVWLSTPISVGSATATDTYLGIFNSSTEYTATLSLFPTVTGTASGQNGVGLAGGYAVGTSTLYAGDGNAAIGQVLSSYTPPHGGATTYTYVANSTTLGQVAWIQTATSSATQVGLYGSGNYYTYTTPASLNSGVSTAIGTYYGESVVGVNANGIAIGGASAFSNSSTGNTSLGSDGWMYNGTSTVPVGLYDSGTTLSLVGYSGGPTSTFNYYFSPSSNVGTTQNTSEGRSTTLYFVNPSGVIAGNSSYYPAGATSSSAQGSIAFTYNAGTYTPLAFTNSSFAVATYPLPVGVISFVNGGSASNVGALNSFPVAINDKGTTTGTQTIYVGTGNSSSGTANQYTNAGRAAWSATSAGVLTQIGLYNQGPTSTFTAAAGAANAGFSASFTIHQNAGQYGTYQDVPQFINTNGLIAGTAQRYVPNTTSSSSLGVDAWVYDPSSGTTYAVDPTDENNAVYVFESVDYLSDTGFVVGQYKVGSSSAPLSTYIWSDAAPTTSFTVLSGVDVTNLTSSGFADLIHSYYVDPTGTITYETAGGTATSSTVTGLVTVVPEPASLSLVALSLLGLGRRHRTSKSLLHNH